MAVYTHEPMGCIPNPHWPCTQVAHLIGDDENELHVFAERIGMQRAWFQAHGRLPHYDLTPQRYEMAIAAGAETMTLREFAVRFLKPRQSPPRRRRRLPEAK
jgi:hypothetical protein